MYKKTFMATTLLVACSVMPSTGQDKQVADTHLDPAKFTLGRLVTQDASGTCFPIQKIKTKTGLKLRLLTARHVVRDYVERKEGVELAPLTVQLFQLEKLIYTTKDVKILKDSKDLDSVLLEITLKGDLDVQPFKLSTTAPKAGQEVWSFGCQAGMIPSFTQGLVCRRTGTDFTARKEAWVTSANVFGGASGGPIVDKKTGTVLGVTSALMQSAQGFVMIPITHVHIFIDASEIRKWLNK